MPTATKDDRRGARERLLEAASRLFYAEGVHTDLAEQLGASEPRVLGRQLHLLWDGASLSARMERDWNVAADARAAAAALVAAAQAR